MATHRLSPPAPGWLQLLTPAYLGRLSAPRRATLIVDLVFRGIAIPGLVLLITDEWPLTVGLVLGALLNVSFSAVFAGRQQIKDDQRDDRDRDMMESLASTPGGAPLMADVRSHCGCVLRYAYQPGDVVWTPVGVLHSADSCLAEAR